MSLPSSGGIVLSQSLNILENFDLTSHDHNSLDYNRLLIEAMRFSFSDRSEFLGDGDFNNFDINRLTSKKYAKSLSTIIKKTENSITEKLNPYKINKIADLNNEIDYKNLLEKIYSIDKGKHYFNPLASIINE